MWRRGPGFRNVIASLVVLTSSCVPNGYWKPGQQRLQFAGPVPASSWASWTWPADLAAPEARHGHAVVSHKDDYVVLFGGRSNDIERFHYPLTYKIGEYQGLFTVFPGQYNNNPVAPDCDPSAPRWNRSMECAPIGDVQIGKYYNDLWIYDLSCSRVDDQACTTQGWRLLHPGGTYGECTPVKRPGEEQVIECKFPQERYNHIATAYADSVYVYGGFAMFCEDYCEDMWRADLSLCLTAPDSNGRWPTEDGHCAVWSEARGYDPVKPHPYKRWRMGHVHVNGFWYVFGGYRLWHGFRQENTYQNRWDQFDVACTPEEWDSCRFQGGYMDDFWVMDMSITGWNQLQRKSITIDDPGRAWENRFRTKNVTIWPSGRAGHAMTSTNCNATHTDGDSCRIWMFGGFRVVFPYPESTSFGYLKGTVGLSSGRGSTPYPTLPYYLNDMWEFNPQTGLWTEIVPSSPSTPQARFLHTMIATNNILYLFGGYQSNRFFNDLWQFNVDTKYFLLKEEHIHPKFPGVCTGDPLDTGSSGGHQDIPNLPAHYYGTTSVNGIPTRVVARTGDTTNNTDGQYGRPTSHRFIPQKRNRRIGWDGCRDKIASIPTYADNKIYYMEPLARSQHAVAYFSKHRLLVLFGGVGYDNYVPTTVSHTYASRTDGEMWALKIDKCMNDCSGRGECAYGFCTCKNGYYGSDCSNISCPGDFCYYDNNTHAQICTHCCSAGEYHRLDGELYNAKTRKVPCDHAHPGENHGICDGFGFCQCAQPYITDDCSVKDCLNNCSGHGWCSIEYPQSRCMVSNIRICASISSIHTPALSDLGHTTYVKNICTQCSRPYEGISCENKACLNNCSYPNGDCVNGTCVCKAVKDPYNNTRNIQGVAYDIDGFDLGWGFASYSGNYAGEDCSYMVVFAAGNRQVPSIWGLLVLFTSLQFAVTRW